jgi:hypothetical protein
MKTQIATKAGHIASCMLFVNLLPVVRPQYAGSHLRPLGKILYVDALPLCLLPLASLQRNI